MTSEYVAERSATRYSTLNVRAGSTLAARLAGPHVAAAATTTSTGASNTPIKYGLTDGAMIAPVDMPTLRAATLSGNPIAMATRLTRTPDDRNILPTPAGVAPTAIRTPISRVR